MVFLTTFPTFQNLPDHQREIRRSRSHTRGLSLAVASLFQGLAPLELSSRSTVATASNSNQWPPQLSKTWSRWVRLGMLSAATATRMRPSPTTTCLFCFKTIQRLRCDAHALHPRCSLVQRENSCARSPCTSMRLGSERGGDDRRAARKAALVSIFLQEADALAIERRHAPGCAGFLEAHQSFHAAAQAMCPCEGGSGAAAGPSGSVHARRRRVRIKSRVTGQNQDG